LREPSKPAWGPVADQVADQGVRPTIYAADNKMEQIYLAFGETACAANASPVFFRLPGTLADLFFL
jgi:hypothetical protein